MVLINPSERPRTRCIYHITGDFFKEERNGQIIRGKSGKTELVRDCL